MTGSGFKEIGNNLFQVKPNIQCIKKEIISFSYLNFSIIASDVILQSNNKDELMLICQAFCVSRWL